MKVKSAKIDIVIEHKSESDCCIEEYHCFKSLWEDTEGNLSKTCKEDNLTSSIIDQYAIAFKNADGVAVIHVKSFY